MTKFMCRLIMDLSKTRQESTVNSIMLTLLLLREREPFQNLEWLDDVEGVLKRVRAMSKTDSTYRTHLGRILTVYPNDVYKRAFDETKAREKAHLESHEKSSREDEKLVSYERVLEVRDRLCAQTKDLVPMTAKHMELLQLYLLVLLYTDFPPRRNDYALMDVVEAEEDCRDPGLNYYVRATRQFVFQQYKTVDQYGVQRFDVPPTIVETLERIVGSRGIGPLLRNQNGSRINPVSALTRLLTKAFGSPMGPTALRHIVLAHEFPTLLDDMEKRKLWASQMAHSLTQQVEYIKREEA